MVSDTLRGRPYAAGMKKSEKGAKTPRGWGLRFRTFIRAKGLNLSAIAEKMGLAESTIRSWTNGTRDVNLSDFLRLCRAAGLDPASVLFADEVDPRFLSIGEAWAMTDEVGRGVLEGAAEVARSRARSKTGTSE
jgi:transcriptional regulator with XRE-family HTH domain